MPSPGVSRVGLAQHGMAIFAHEQTAGKGQRGKKWLTFPDQNIALSIILNPGPFQLSQQFWLSACAAVSIHNVFKNYAGSDTRIKWPNDIYWKDGKIGGILIESIVRGRETVAGSREPGVESREPGAGGGEQGGGGWDWAVIGIGININQETFPQDLPNPISLKQITGKSFDPVELAKEICRSFNDYFEKLNHDGFKEIYSEYLSHLYKIDEKVKLKKDSRVFEAILKGVSPEGKLILQHGIEEEFDFGTIEWVM
jgi:BirA family biotin operon repressor/biotin-[acetyl-CoA-carboxylase] ligase